MSINVASYSNQMASTPLRKSNVTFAGRKENAEGTKESKSNTGKYVAAGLTLATVAAAIVFRKDISKFIRNIKLPNISNSVSNIASNIRNGFQAGVQRVGAWGQAARTRVTNAMPNLQNFGSKVLNGAKTVWNTAKKWAGAVKNFFVSAYNTVKGWFAKPQPQATQATLPFTP